MLSALISVALLTPSKYADIPTKVQEQMHKAKLPAVGVAVVSSNGIEYIFVRGALKMDGSVAATEKHMWHMGSCTKSMTAMVVARLAEQGKLDLDMPLDKVFTEFKVHEKYKVVTLRHLLAHQGGIGQKFDFSLIRGKPVPEQVQLAAKYFLESAPQAEVGKYEYANYGIVIAGAAAAKVAGKSIDELLSDQFASMGIKQFGFGPAGEENPWPHRDGVPARGPHPGPDNPPVITSAGRVHMTLPEWGKYIQEHLKAFKGESKIVPQLYLREMTKPPLKTFYSMGWAMAPRPWAGGMAFNHTGSNNLNYCIVWMAPGKDKAYLVVTNNAGKGVAESVELLVTELVTASQRPGNLNVLGE